MTGVVDQEGGRSIRVVVGEWRVIEYGDPFEATSWHPSYTDPLAGLALVLAAGVDNELTTVDRGNGQFTIALEGKGHNLRDATVTIHEETDEILSNRLVHSFPPGSCTFDAQLEDAEYGVEIESLDYSFCACS